MAEAAGERESGRCVMCLLYMLVYLFVSVWLVDGLWRGGDVWAVFVV